MSSAVSLKFQQKDPGPINEVYEKIMFSGLKSGVLNRARLHVVDNGIPCGVNTKKSIKKSIKLTENAKSWLGR